MAANERASDFGLTLLQTQGTELNFFQAIRLLEPALAPDHKLRFKVLNSDAFQPSFIADVSHKAQADNTRVTTVTVTGFGAIGMQGPVPQCYTELLQRSEVKGKNGNEDPQGFLDIFHDRLISLLYEIKKHFNPMLFNEKPEDNQLYTLFSSVCGLSMTQLFDRLPVSDAQLASFAPILANRRVDYSHLKNGLSRYLDCDINITPNQGAWKTLLEELRAKLQGNRQALSATQQQGLGKGIGLGRRYWDNQADIGVDVYLPNMERFQQLLPGGEKHPEFRAMLSFLTDGKYQFHVRLLIDWKGIPDSKVQQKKPLRLGQAAWLHVRQNRPQSQDISQFVLNPSIGHDFSDNFDPGQDLSHRQEGLY